MRTLQIREYPHCTIAVNKIEYVQWMEEENMRSRVFICTGIGGHVVNFETIDQGINFYEKVIEAMNL